VYPTTQVSAPFAPDIKKSPRLQALDTGLLNFVCGLQGGLIGAEDLNAQYGGKIAEHIVGQEVLAAGFEASSTLRFWARDKAQSNAEVDFLFPFEGRMIPIEVKSGKNGRLRSVHQFIDNSDCDFAVRLYAGATILEDQKTIAGKPFKLLNLPYFLAGFLRRQLEFASAYKS
jgi:predicted AAA+ superfamily ATPase